MINKNLAIANKSRVSCAHITLKSSIYPVTLKSKLRVTQGHWKWNHWTDHHSLNGSSDSVNGDLQFLWG